MGGAGAVVVIIANEKKIVDAFRRAGAIDARSAVAPGSIGVTERLPFRQLRQRAVLREAEPGRLYLDEPSWEALQGRRRRLGLACLLIIVLAGLAVWLVAR